MEEKASFLLNSANKDLIVLDVEVKDAEEAIKLGCSILEKSGAVTSKYCGLILNSFHENGPYFVIYPRFALLHARNEDGCVKWIAASFIRLAKPINFGHSENDPVDMILTLASPDESSHLNLLKKISGLLMSNDINILRSGGLDEIFDIFNFLFS